jgi:hypothetical protein
VAVDLAAFVTDLKAHAMEHGFHVHDERHFIESYSLGQAWEVDLHPGEACDGPVEMLLVLEVDPRILLGFGDLVAEQGEEVTDDEGVYTLPLFFKWALPPLDSPPDLLVLATDLAGIGRTGLPIEVSAIDSFAAVTDAPQRSLSLVGRVDVPLVGVFMGDYSMCDVLDIAHDVAMELVDRSADWLES